MPSNPLLEHQSPIDAGPPGPPHFEVLNVESSAASISGKTLVEDDLEDVQPAEMYRQYPTSLPHDLQQDHDDFHSTPLEDQEKPHLPWRTIGDWKDVGYNLDPRPPSSLAGSVGSLRRPISPGGWHGSIGGTTPIGPIPQGFDSGAPRPLIGRDQSVIPVGGGFVFVKIDGELDDSTVDVQQNRPTRVSTKFGYFVEKLFGHVLRVIHQVDQIRGPPHLA